MTEEKSTVRRFNLRVYGVLLNDSGSVLVADEYRNGREITKFPGGGLEFGEGLGECLKREFFEELNLAVEIRALLYVNDFAQVSAFNPEEQVISFYFLVECADMHCLASLSHGGPKYDKEEGYLAFRWLDTARMSPDNFQLPIDKQAALALLDHLDKNKITRA